MKRRFRLWGRKSDDLPVGAVIGVPYNFQQITHVKPDPRTSTGFTGLPAEWRMVLKASGITSEEAVEHPQAVLDALAFHMDGPPPKQQLRQKMPTKEAMDKNLNEVRAGSTGQSLARSSLLLGDPPHFLLPAITTCPHGFAGHSDSHGGSNTVLHWLEKARAGC
jgi:hypothetical protein